LAKFSILTDKYLQNFLTEILPPKLLGFNPLSTIVGYTPHDDDIICSGCSALFKQNY